jgi:hypothetical protein
MILIRQYTMIGKVPLNAKIILKIAYKSGDRDAFKGKHGFDPYDSKQWYAFLAASDLARRAPNGREYRYQVFRWGQFSSGEPFGDKKYVSLFPGRHADGRRRILYLFPLPDRSSEE